jgi:XTP/dITP diphosphohydrolase
LKTIVIGTGNKHKVHEIAPVLLQGGLPVTLKVASDYGHFDPDETGKTLEENAIIKASAAEKLSGEWSIADDTGLFVDALDGRPGIYAARYAGPGCSFADNVAKLLGELKDVPMVKRTALFACVIALCRPGHAPQLFRGECKGFIALEPSGSGGFGYDPVFKIFGLNKSFAEITTEEKNRLSHRSIATQMCRAELKKLLS